MCGGEQTPPGARRLICLHAHSLRYPTEIKMKAFLAITAAACFLFVAGCNTMEGAGKDVKAGGEKVEKEAVEHKKY